MGRKIVSRIKLNGESYFAFVDPQFPGSKGYQLQVNLNDIPLDMSTEANPRTSRRNSAIVKKIVKIATGAESVEAPFSGSNGGMHISAESVSIIMDQGIRYMELTFSEPYHGVYNGGHTYLAIKLAKEIGIRYNGLISITVHTGLSQEQVVKMIKYHSTTKGVKGYSMMYSLGSFDWIESLFIEKRIRENVKFEEGELTPSAPSILDFLRIMLVTDPKRFPLDAPTHKRVQPDGYYSSVNKVQASYEEDMNYFKDRIHVIDFLGRLASLILTFAPTILKKDIGKNRDDLFRKCKDGNEAALAYNKAGDENDPNFEPKYVPGTVPWIWDSKHNKPVILEEMLYTGVLLPCIAPLRMLITNSGKLRMGENQILNAFRYALPETLSVCAVAINKAGGVDAAAGQKSVWADCFSAFETELEEFLKQHPEVRRDYLSE